MADLYGREDAIAEAERQAERGTPKAKDPCAALVAKVSRQPAGSARRKLAEQELARCRANSRQSTDGNN